MMTGTNDNLKQPLVHLEQMSWGLNVLYSCVSSCCGGLKASSEIDSSFGVYTLTLSPGCLNSAL